MMLNDDKIALISALVDEEMFNITEQIVTNYGRRGCIFVAIPSRTMVYATMKELNLRATMYPHNDDVKLLQHLVKTYRLYNEAVVAIVREYDQSLICLTKLEIDSVKLTNFGK